jgi:hypothetical protein
MDNFLSRRGESRRFLMRNLLSLFAFAVLVFTGAGWYLGWYKVQSNPAPDGHRSYNVDINGRKIQEDLQRGKQKLQEAMDQKSKDNDNTTADRGRDDSFQQ